MTYENPLAALISTNVSRRDAQNIPVPKYMLAVLIHANSLDDIQREVAMLETDLITEYAGREHIDANSGRLSFRLDLTHPGQTQEMYDEQLRIWSEKRRASSDSGAS